MIYNRDDLTLMADGNLSLTLELGPLDKAWNPERNDMLLRGPARVIYCFWSDGGVDFTFLPRTMEPSA